MGYIYIIKNKVNNLVYIGQTLYSIEERFKKHIYDMKRFSYRDLYKDMNKYGVENFYIEELEECDSYKLDEREIYWISYYDSYHNGYNHTIGGGSYIRNYEEISNETLESLVKDYKNGYSCMDIATKYSLSVPLVSRILKNKLGSIKVDNPLKNRETKNIPIALNMYNNDFNYEKSFKSVKEAIDWLNKNTTYNVNSINGYAYIKKAYLTGCIAYGHRWQRKEDLILNEIIFRSIFDKNAFLNGVSYKIENGLAVCEGAISHLYKIKTITLCKDCGKSISKGCTLCKDCRIKMIQGMSKMPDKETLEKLIKEHSFVEIGRHFGVSDNAVRKWCKKYGLPFKRKNLK